MTTKNNRTVLGILFLIFIFFVLLMIFAIYTIDVIQKHSGELGRSQSEAQIGVIEIEGVIMESRPIIELLHRAQKSERIKAIILRINSPGGAVGPTQEIYEEIRRIDQAWTPNESDKEGDRSIVGKPIYASFGSIAASGGYYVGSATRKIYSSPGTLTGSIGVIMQFLDLSELFHMAKINQKNVKSGRFKDVGMPNRSMTAEEEDLLSQLVEGVHQQFINDILATRETLLKKDIDYLAQGQIFSGADAYEYGLVDELAGLWEAGRRVHAELELKGELDFVFIEKRKRIGLFDILESFDAMLGFFSGRVSFNNVPALMFTP